MKEDLTREEVVTSIDEMINSLLATAGVARPPIDAVTLAQQHLGLLICLDQGHEQRERSRNPRGSKQVLLSPDQTEEQKQWTVARAVGGHLKADLLQRLGFAAEERRALMGESLANLIAGRLLVPSCWLQEEARSCDFDLLELKRLFGTAIEEVIAGRLLDLSEPCIITLIESDLVQRRRSNAWRVRKELSEPEKRCQRSVSLSSQPALVREKGWTVQGWPIHRADGTRVILRSVVDEDADS